MAKRHAEWCRLHSATYKEYLLNWYVNFPVCAVGILDVNFRYQEDNIIHFSPSSV